MDKLIRFFVVAVVVFLLQLGCTSPPPSDLPETIKESNLKVDSVKTDTIHVEDMVCRVDGNVLASAAILGGISNLRERFNECVDEPQSPRVYFFIAKGKLADLKLKGIESNSEARCVFDALRDIKMSGSAECLVTVMIKPGESKTEPSKK